MVGASVGAAVVVVVVVVVVVATFVVVVGGAEVVVEAVTVAAVADVEEGMVVGAMVTGGRGRRGGGVGEKAEPEVASISTTREEAESRDVKDKVADTATGGQTHTERKKERYNYTPAHNKHRPDTRPEQMESGHILEDGFTF